MKRVKLLLPLLLISIFFVPTLYASTPTPDTSHDVIYGCMNPKALNYNPMAKVDNGSCIFDSTHQTTSPVIFGCTNPKALNYNRFAKMDNGTCVFDSTENHNEFGGNNNDTTVNHMDSIKNHMKYGCKDSTALNYNPYALYDNHNCKYTRTIPGCTDSLALNFKPKANVNDGSCKYEHKIWGCTDSTALNFNPKANQNNGRCRYTAIVRGCTDKSAINYNPLANKDNRTCIFISNDSIPGCTDPYALNYNKHAMKDNGNCKYETVTDTLRGCMDSTALNFDPIATKPGRCVFTKDTTVIFGCKSHKALNFSRNATKDDGSCVFALPGNMFVSNFISNNTAIVDTVAAVLKASCNFDYTTPIDTAYIVSITKTAQHQFEIQWVIQQDTITTTIKTVVDIQKEGTSLFYLSLVCNQGTTSSTSTGMSKISSNSTSLVNAVTVSSFGGSKIISGFTNPTMNENGINFYPNPVSDQLNLNYSTSTSDKLELNIYSVDGRRVSSTSLSSVSGTNSFVINTSDLKAGLHFMTINRNGAIVDTIKFAKY